MPDETTTASEVPQASASPCSNSVDLRAHRQHPGRDDLGERGDLGLADVGRGEADAVGHDVAHDPTGRCSRYQSIVRSSPSSSSTAASNPSSSRALPMFGIRSSTST